MANGNGETFLEIRKILETNSKIPSKVATRLTLAALADLREEQKGLVSRVKEVEDDSIILWAKRNKIIAGVLVALIMTSPIDTIYNILLLLATHLK